MPTNCDYCDRNNVVRAYCYYRSRPEFFRFVTGRSFSVKAFAEYAVEVELRWRISLCENMTRNGAREFWIVLEPALRLALQEANVLKGRRTMEVLEGMSNFDND